MENQTQDKIKKIRRIEPKTRRRYFMGGFFLLVAGFIWFTFSHNIGPDVQTTFVLTPGGASSILPDITFNTRAALNIFAGICLILGIYQLIIGFGKYTNLILTFIGAILTISFLAWGQAGVQLI